MKKYDTLRIEATVPRDRAEEASFLLARLGCGSILELAAAGSASVTLVANFDARGRKEAPLADEVSETFRTFPGLADAQVTCRRERIGDLRDAFKQRFAPFEIAHGIVVVPSWERYERRAGDSVIELDPGMAFGTGLHETTRLCARSLASRARGIRSLLDVGTGSGILAIAGRLMGAERICAVENDPDALAVARENLDKNGCSDVALLPRLEMAKGRYDAVVANILLSTLIELRDPMVDRVEDNGVLILSGITADQEAEIISSYAGAFAAHETDRDGEWSAVIFRRDA
ncbi:MAG: 50S ribosomal protein L11 methyltransferase [Proteobacteria bacterium]|nr:50S ribosomal protein L11 methyltransferase [Pseudomonadota bacterium]